MKITETRTEQGIILKTEGRVDANTYMELQEKILRAFQKDNHLELDFEQVSYISSAGLRVLLIGQKTAAAKSGSMVLKNVCSDVMKVIKMSGFDKILTVQ